MIPIIAGLTAGPTGAVAAPLVVTRVIGALIFCAAGVIAGTAVEGIMDSYGGAVATGSVCATLQSI